MGKISIDLNSFKAAGIYTLEVDNTARVMDSTTDSLRLLVGFSNKGPFNRPVLLLEDADRLRVFGDIDTKLEHKGSFFNRMARTLLTGGPVIALNLLDVSTSYSGPDRVNLALMSMNAGEANPESKILNPSSYSEYDYLADSLDKTVYGTVKGDPIPFVGETAFASLYNRSRFWVPDKNLLTAEAARNLDATENPKGYSFETANLLNFANVGTDEISILVFKTDALPGYEVTAESWYGGKENIPFGWIRPYDNVSDYFLQVVCVKGNWSNYPVLSTDPVWKGYFTKTGIKRDRVNAFLSAEGITVLGSWTGSIIPDFTDQQGNMLSLEAKVNAATERTGLLMSFNLDLANVLTYDYSGLNTGSSDPDSGSWTIDMEGDGEGESAAKYIVDLVGHEVFTKDDVSVSESWENASIYGTIAKSTDSSHYYVYNPGRNRYFENNSGCELKQLYVSDASVNVSIYDSNNPSTAQFVKAVNPGKFIAVPDNSSITAVPYNSDNILNLAASKYYTISKAGSLNGPSQLNISKLEMGDPSNAVANASLLFELDGTQFAQIVNASIDSSNNNITAINSISFKYLDTSANSSTVIGINFLSYNYVANPSDGVKAEIKNVRYFSDQTLWKDKTPVSADTKNMFIITDASNSSNAVVKLGDYVRNITFKNEPGQTEEYQLIPGLSKVIRKQFVPCSSTSIASEWTAIYRNNEYTYVGPTPFKLNNQYGFYLVTCVAPVLIEDGKVVRQLPMNDERISESLRFIPMKGLNITSRHRPGYDASGNLDIEDGIAKVYGVLKDDGIRRGLLNPQMVDYRYIIDSMSYGLGPELGGKVELSRLAKDRGKCTAILNLPSAKQFAVSSNPYFCDTYTPGREARPSMSTKYIPEGGNTEMGSSIIFSLPSEEDGAKFTACFWPHLIYQENGKEIVVPPAADVANVLNRKFTGISDPYAICANQNGILSNRYLKGLEFLADLEDREYLEPFGVNTIIKDQGAIMIYANQTAYQAMKSDFNKLHIRENLNTAEIECERVLKKYNFLYNTPAVRANIVQQLTPILQAMQIAGALVKYEIICDETNNTPEVIEADTCIVEVNLWMNHGMEKIVQKFTLQRLDR